MPSKRSAVAALKKLDADRLALDERKRELEEQAALELGRVILGTGLATFSKKGLARVAVLLGELGEEGALEQFVALPGPSRRSGHTSSQ